MNKNLIAIFLILFVLVNSFEVQAKQKRNDRRKNVETLLQEGKSVLIRKIVLSGYVLKSTKSLNKVIKSYQNKSLSQGQIEQIIEEIRSIYFEAGYAGLVSIDYQVVKTQLDIKIVLNK